MFDSRPDKDEQGEFFSNYSEMSKKSRKGTNFSLGKVAVSLSYENIIILSIGLVMLLIVCYSLGVEKGRHLVQAKSEDIGLEQEEAQKIPKIESPKPKEKKMKIEVVQTEDISNILPYIQVASFRTDKYARKEIEQLKNRGYRPFAATRGKYRVVCVGGYKNKDEARKAMKELKEVYTDCILRVH